MRRMCAVIAIVLAFVCTVGSAGPPTMSAAGAAAISRMFQAAVDHGEIPGVVAAVTNRDRILYLEAFGKQDVARGVPMAKDTMFRIASMTKPMKGREDEKAGRLVTISRREESGLVEAPNAPVYTAAVRGDGGLLSTVSDYSAFLQTLLNHGSWRGARLLKAESVRLMASNQIGAVHVEEMPAVLPRTAAAFPAGAGKDKFGPGFQIAVADGEAIHERGAGSYTWGGINNTHFWVDPKNGVGVLYLTQVLPFYDRTTMDVLKRFEHLIYEHLQIR